MIYDVNNINDENHFTELKNKLVRKDFVTYTCRNCGILVNKGSRCYKNFNNLCHSCSVSNTIANRPIEIQNEINSKVQASRKTHQDEINERISYSMSHRTEEQLKISKEKRHKTCLEKYGDENYNNKEQAQQTMLKLYGGTATLNSKLKKKAQQTNIQKYGGISPMCSDIIVDKLKTTYIKNNGGMGFASDKVKETFKKNYKEKFGVENSSQNPIVRRKQAVRYQYNGINFDSKPEIAYYIWLTDHNIEFEYQPNVKFEYFYQNKIHYYIPDFIVNGEYQEIKGLHFFKNGDMNETMINPFDRTQDDKYEAKHQCMIKNNVKILTNFDEYIKYVKDTYGKQFLDSLKRK